MMKLLQHRRAALGLLILGAFLLNAAGVFAAEAQETQEANWYYPLAQINEGKDPHGRISGRDSTNKVADLVVNGLPKLAPSPIGPTQFPPYSEMRGPLGKLMRPACSMYTYYWPSHLDFIK